MEGGRAGVGWGQTARAAAAAYPSPHFVEIQRYGPHHESYEIEDMGHPILCYHHPEQENLSDGKATKAIRNEC